MIAGRARCWGVVVVVRMPFDIDLDISMFPGVFDLRRHKNVAVLDGSRGCS
jgi:hypothetical protein